MRRPAVRLALLFPPVGPSPSLAWAGRRRCISSSADAPSRQTLKAPFFFDTGHALFAKRPSRPFPPPFLSPPSGSFSEPLSTHHHSRDRRPSVEGELIRGLTNGDDAVLMQDNFIGADDGVGAWSTKPKGHAALWSRLILHFWAVELDRQVASDQEPEPVVALQRAYDHTVAATSSPNEWLGTTTVCGALLHSRPPASSAMLYVTNLGDSQVLVIRPGTGQVLYKTTEQWHWFDCPRQLGTNSPDSPGVNAVMDKVPVEENDVVLAMSDGVIDNLWEHEVVQNVLDSLARWPSLAREEGDEAAARAAGIMTYVARQLVAAARVIAEDPFAESPFMERAVEEGLAMEGGKLDDISVVAAVCRRRHR